ncbi:Enhancer of polycomb-like protein 1 [Coniosporium apollinis]|uniref:Enhancer of polycomb-like protein n=1 Tax=Coniosporium apollinis TaxID=61459 RepID=A0ABQ9NHE9_9PEZI|nr:Enhancer of polycomb-like protein 1 [Coniosporium apollinis]
MTQRTTGQRFRQRKLSTRQNLPVLREHEVEKISDDDAARHIPKVESGVDKGEETEHHLQAVISASHAAAVGGKIAQLYIPTPETIQSTLEYERLYPRQFKQPSTYIRFSSTVEDCIGCPYCMTADDDLFLKSMNQKKPASQQCSEDQFEEVMYFFEETSASKQPFAAVDNPPVVSYEEMEASFDETISDSCRTFAREIYEHWKNQRLLKGNRALMPTLKFETNVETDDNDPYVCFRRREVRQTRKTRGRDAQVIEKLKKMRKDLEDARQILHVCKQREYLARENWANNRKLFEQRILLRDAKRENCIKEDDDLLVDQKPVPKPKLKTDQTNLQRQMSGTAKAQVARMDGRPPDSDLVLLEEVTEKKQEDIQKFMDDLASKHRNWNKDWRDETWRPLTPPPQEQAQRSSFRAATTYPLPTPPPSIASEGSGEPMDIDEPTPRALNKGAITVQYASPPLEAFVEPQRAFRRRIARGGRLVIDRRGIKRPSQEDIDDRILDRYKYDQESSEDDEVYPYDPYDNAHIKFRVLSGSPDQSRSAQQQAQMRRGVAEAPMANGVLHPNHARMQGSPPQQPSQ